ncbi:MAG: DUF120 domain-containing protein [Methanospirillaceae archaeon]|nr:DUF120 domain-containing protein [Methanospirillaceae archaeon]
MLAADDLICLKRIALLGGLMSPVLVNSQVIGQELGISPQTASRRLKSLESGNYITRSLVPDGQQILITRAGEAELRQEYCDYYRLFGRTGEMKQILTGIVESGLGEGAYYMSLAPYCRQFHTYLGFTPYPGTLNIRLSPAAVAIRKRLGMGNWHVIEGFESEGRTFGKVQCIGCTIQDITCGIIVPGRSHYPEDIIEVIAPTGLRESLCVSDGDEVTVEVLL